MVKIKANYNDVPEEYRDEAYYYAVNVIEGVIVASKKVIKACKRHIKDLLKIDNEDYPFIYLPDRGNDVVEFMELLPDPKTMKTYPLAEFQKFIILSLYGWRKKTNYSLRRFRKAYISIARKNGKTILVAGIALYEFLFGNEPEFGRQIYFTANDKKQAGIAFKMASKQLAALSITDEWVRSATKKVREELRNLEDDSYMWPLSRDTGAVDGYEPHVGVLDEYGANKTNEMLELIESGQTLLLNSLILIISTAGNSLNVPMFTQEYPYITKLLDEQIENDEYFAFCAEQDNEKEISDSRTWYKSNPILYVRSQFETVYDYLEKRLTEAKEKGNINKVLIKNFNIWRQAEEKAYMQREDWENVLLDYKPDIKGKDVWIGIDVGKTSDLFGITWFVQEDNSWFVDAHAFVGTKYGLEGKEERDGLEYRRLEEKGEVSITKLASGVIDTEEVFSWLENFVSSNELNVKCIAYDPAQYGTLLTMIEKKHPEWLQVSVRQGTLSLSMPTKQFRDEVINGTIRHAGNEVLNNAVYNAITLEDNNGIRIDKNKNSNKIDVLDAGLDAYAICFTEFIAPALTDDDIFNEDFGF